MRIQGSGRTRDGHLRWQHRSPLELRKRSRGGAPCPDDAGDAIDRIGLSFPATSRFSTATIDRAGDTWSSTVHLRAGGAAMRTPVASFYGQSADDSPNTSAVLARPERKIVGGMKRPCDLAGCRIKDQDGKDLPNWAHLPMQKDLPDDPYRTLAWMVRKCDGYCRAHMQGKKGFAEFRRADWFRTRLSVDPVSKARTNNDPIVDAALRLAGSPEARNLPGYRVEGFASTCPPDPV